MDNVYGMTVDLYGPLSLRRHDLVLVNGSEVNDRMAAVQEEEDEEDQCVIFGDSAYIQLSHIQTYIDDGYLIKKVRVTIEWNYGLNVNLFRYLTMNNKLKLMESTTVAKIYTVAILFKNFHVCLYGCETSKYFNAEIPFNMLQNYINQDDF